MATRYWLMKAEPDSRIVKGKDVKFSVDDFESVQTTAWEGVRNAEARNLMKEMSIGDKVLFYHSNCKNPGIAALAEVSKDAYPDYTAWDPDHPYYDQKTDKKTPRWYMVDVTFQSRLAHFIPLSLLKSIAGSSTDTPTEELEYIGAAGVKSIKNMALVTRGRLSVQRVEEVTYDILVQMGERGGWNASAPRPSGAMKKRGSKTNSKSVPEDGNGRDTPRTMKAESSAQTSKGRGAKRKVTEVSDLEPDEHNSARRQTRQKR